MSLHAEFKHALAATPPFHLERLEPRLVEAAHGDLRVQCQMAALDSLGCEFTSLVVEAPRLRNASIEQLKELAGQLATRLTYLLEPISPVEFDADHCLVQMRSTPPQKDDDLTSYYELLVSREGNLSLCRYSRPRGSVRTIVPAQVTREVLLRLVRDFSAAAA